MAATAISDLWVPQIWIRGTDEKARSLPSLITSGAVVQNPLLDNAASGGGISVNLPFFKDLTDTAESVQAEGAEPTINNIGSGSNVAAVLNREVGFGVNALAAAVTGDDPVGGITRQLALNRQKRLQAVALSILRGLFNTAGAPAASAVLSSVRYDAFSETGASPGATLLIDTYKVNNTIALLGELAGDLMSCALWMHPNIRAALRNQDEISFEKASLGDFQIETYKGMPVFQSNLLSRAGGVSGTVYDTYFLSPGVIGYGAKAQVGDQIDVASLQYFKKPDINQERIYDRTRSLVHINGTKWTGTPSGQSATNAELATSTNWALAFQTADRVGIACIRTNG